VLVFLGHGGIIIKGHIQRLSEFLAGRKTLGF
jgi:hypothetical protein